MLIQTVVPHAEKHIGAVTGWTAGDIAKHLDVAPQGQCFYFLVNNHLCKMEDVTSWTTQRAWLVYGEQKLFEQLFGRDFQPAYD